MKEDNRRLDEMIMQSIGARYRAYTDGVCAEPLPPEMRRLLASIDGNGGAETGDTARIDNPERRAR